MSEHKTGKSNWSREQKDFYWERRRRGLRGSIGYANVVKTVKDEHGNDQIVPIGYKKGRFLSSRKPSK